MPLDRHRSHGAASDACGLTALSKYSLRHDASILTSSVGALCRASFFIDVKHYIFFLLICSPPCFLYFLILPVRITWTLVFLTLRKNVHITWRKLLSQQCVEDQPITIFSINFEPPNLKQTCLSHNWCRPHPITHSSCHSVSYVHILEIRMWNMHM